jgi:hypothetical protein
MCLKGLLLYSHANVIFMAIYLSCSSYGVYEERCEERNIYAQNKADG